jgi:ABC-type bacteriocin/lantibiotic exporter with double-glycine peptidase domain
MDDSLIRDAHTELTSILEAQPSLQTNASNSSLLRAMGTVGHAIGVQIQPPITDNFEKLKNPILAIAQASKIRVRRIQLTGNWWQQDQGALLAFWQDSQPIALLPTSKGYELVDPLTRNRTSVNTALASQIKPHAYILYRPFPENAHTAIDLIGFSLHGLIPTSRHILVTGISVTLLGMIVPQLLAILINQVIPAGDRTSLWQIGLVLVAIA